MTLTRWMLIGAALFFFCGCGGRKPAHDVISISLLPAVQVAIDQGQTLNFRAILDNDTGNQGVRWTVTGTGCSDSACGTLTNISGSTATYHAPSTLSSGLSVIIRASAVADPTKTAYTAVEIGLPPAISMTTLPYGTVGAEYRATLAASGGVGMLTWRLSPGSSLPAGLSWSSAGVISGRPMAAGSLTLTVQVSDSSGAPDGPCSATQPLRLIIDNAPLSIFATTLPEGVLKTSYGVKLQVSGGVSPYTWRLTPGSALPSGLSLQPSGTISGIPAATGTTVFTVKVTDSTTPTPQTATQGLSIVVNAADPLVHGANPF